MKLCDTKEQLHLELVKILIDRWSLLFTLKSKKEKKKDDSCLFKWDTEIRTENKCRFISLQTLAQVEITMIWYLYFSFMKSVAAASPSHPNSTCHKIVYFYLSYASIEDETFTTMRQAYFLRQSNYSIVRF